MRSGTSPTVSSLAVTGERLTVTGENLDFVKEVGVESDELEFPFRLTSRTNKRLEATPASAANFLLGTTYRLVLTSAKASEFPITFEVPSSFPMKVSSITSNTTLDETHNVVLVNSSSNVSITLPAGRPGRNYYIKKTSTGTSTVTITPNGSETIDGATSVTLYVPYDAVRIISDGSNWNVIGNEIQSHQVKLSRVTAQTVSDNSTTKLNLDSIVYDNAGLADLSNSRIVIRRTGRYSVIGFVDFGTASGVAVVVNKNGSRLGAQGLSNASATELQAHVAESVPLNAGDVIELLGYQSSGSSQATNTVTGMIPRISVTELR